MAIIYYLIFINFLIFFQLDIMILLMYSKLFVFLAAALFCQLTINTVDKDIQILCQRSTAKITPAMYMCPKFSLSRLLFNSIFSPLLKFV